MRPVPTLSTSVQRVRYKVYGLVFLLVLAMLLGLTVAIYNKTFTPVVLVDLKAARSGLQLLPHSDVKVRGLIVGEVRDIATDGHTATVTLALDPDEVGQVPRNVRARLLPKTIFGEKYVDLVIPGQASPGHIEAGDVIPEDRSRTAIELNRVFDDLLPLLRTLQPQKVNATLHAISTALEGRGEKIGDNLVRLDSYLSKLNPDMPVLRKDISELADVLSTYSDAAPDLLRVLRNFTAVSGTVVEKQDTLKAFLGDVTQLAGTGRGFLSANEERIIKVNSVNRSTLGLLARYSPEYPCLLGGLARLEPRLEKAFGGEQPGLHITLEVKKPRPPYEPGVDRPEWGEHRGPRCYGLPDHPPVPAPASQLKDGTQDDSWSSTGGSSSPQGLLSSTGIPILTDSHASSTRSHGRPLSAALVDASSGYAGTAGEQKLVGYIVGPGMGTPPSEVPDIADLLFGPMIRGTVVNVE